MLKLAAWLLVVTNVVVPFQAPPALAQLKKVADFDLLVPRNTAKFYKLEIKEPYPVLPNRAAPLVRLHYFDPSGRRYIFGIEEHAAAVDRDESIVPVGEIVRLGDIEARFVPRANGEPGGYVWWVQDGTYIEIDSGELTKRQMIRMARSLKKL